MPIKWKIYYVCGWYTLVWTILMALAILYNISEGAIVKNPVGVLIFGIGMIITLAMHGIYGIRFFQHLNKGTMFTEKERSRSSVMSVLSIILVTLLMLVLVFKKSSGFLNETSAFQVIYHTALILGVISVVFLSIMRKKMTFTIHDNVHDAIDTIGADITADDHT